MGTTVGRRNARGATAVEYALLISLMAAVIFGMVVLFGNGVVGLFTDTHDSIVSHTP